MGYGFPHVCPDYCNDPRTMESYGCLGPTEHPQGYVDVMGEQVAIHECPFRIASRDPEVLEAVSAYFAFHAHGIMPNDGGWCDQSLGFKMVRTVCGAARAEIQAAMNRAAER